MCRKTHVSEEVSCTCVEAEDGEPWYLCTGFKFLFGLSFTRVRVRVWAGMAQRGESIQAVMHCMWAQPLLVYAPSPCITTH